jgi:hypothetical protein
LEAIPVERSKPKYWDDLEAVYFWFAGVLLLGGRIE